RNRDRYMGDPRRSAVDYKDIHSYTPNKTLGAKLKNSLIARLGPASGARLRLGFMVKLFAFKMRRICMKLFYSPGACSLSPHIALLEVGAKFELEKVDLRAKTYSKGDYRAVNLKGSVPAIEMSNGEILTEGAVILQYIGDQFPNSNLIPKAGSTERYRTQEWLN